MGKTNNLERALGDSLAEETGYRQDRSEPGLATQLPATPDPLDDRQRLKGACTLPIGSVIPDPRNPRTVRDAEADADFIEDIRKRGIQSPPRVRKDAALGKYVILNGGRRHMAALALGLVRIPVIVIDRDLTPGEIREEMWAENKHRKDIDPIDEANFFKSWLEEEGITQQELAKRLRLNPGTISNSLSLLRTDPTVQEQISAGKLSAKAGVAIAKIKNPKVQREIATKAVEEDSTADEVAADVRQKRGKPAPKRSRTGARPGAADAAKQTVEPGTYSAVGPQADLPDQPRPVRVPLADQRVFRLEPDLEVVIRSTSPVSDEVAIFAARRVLRALNAPATYIKVKDVPDVPTCQPPDETV